MLNVFVDKKAGTSRPAVHRVIHAVLAVAYLALLGVLAAQAVKKRQPYYESLKQRPVMRYLQRLQARLSSD